MKKKTEEAEITEPGVFGGSGTWWWEIRRGEDVVERGPEQAFGPLFGLVESIEDIDAIYDLLSMNAPKPPAGRKLQDGESLSFGFVMSSLSGRVPWAAIPMDHSLPIWVVFLRRRWERWDAETIIQSGKWHLELPIAVRARDRAHMRQIVQHIAINLYPFLRPPRKRRKGVLNGCRHEAIQLKPGTIRENLAASSKE